jgi:hypothetical protein
MQWLLTTPMNYTEYSKHNIKLKEVYVCIIKIVRFNLWNQKLRIPEDNSTCENTTSAHARNEPPLW